MPRETIDYGIDLGTTNSCIAVLKGTDTEIIDNNEGQKYTPSAVWVKPGGSLLVGKTAKDRLGEDNAYAEFKNMMGSDFSYSFTNREECMKPEELSAEVLKELKNSVYQKKGETITAAAISVPAAFTLPQCEATDKAARLAGLSVSPLIQEPIAAALAYGFQSKGDRVFWLVYDLGGGTFDAAIIHLIDGEIQVVNHGGDANLGGKLIDWGIVNKLLIPALLENNQLTDFVRSNAKWNTAFAKLKAKAEEAKIALSHAQDYEINIEYLCNDDNDKPVSFDCELKRSDVEKIIEPYLERSVNICNKVLAEKKLGSGDVEKVLLVGGPTLTPMIREGLKDKLGIPLEFSIDPLTVVARGAAIFAGSQRLPASEATTAGDSGQYIVNLEYKPVDSDTEPLVGGVVLSPDQTPADGLTIEFIESKSKWRSGKIALSENGSFMSNLRAEKKRTNKYVIEVRDEVGNPLKATPESFTYTVGSSIANPPLIHSIGVALANNQMQVFLKKGTPLPARRVEWHRTTVEVQQGNTGTLLRIPVVEGENTKKADRNKLIGNIEVTGDHVKRNVPAGSEVEITIEINESRLVIANAYLPILDEPFAKVLDLKYEALDRQKMQSDLEIEKKRLAAVKENSAKMSDSKANQVLERIEKEQIVEDVESVLDTANHNEDVPEECSSRLLDLTNALDEAESAMEWPARVKEAEELITSTQNIVKDFGKQDEQAACETMVKNVREAIDSGDPVLLQEKIDEMRQFNLKLLAEKPEFWVVFFNHLTEMKGQMRDQNRAEDLIREGRLAVSAGNVDKLKCTVVQLIELLPLAEQEKVKGFGGTTIIA